MQVSVIRTAEACIPVEVLVCQSGARLLKPISCAEKRQAVLNAWMHALNQVPVAAAVASKKDPGPTLLPVEETVPACLTIVVRGSRGSRQQSAPHVGFLRAVKLTTGYFETTAKDLRNRGARGHGKSESWKCSGRTKQFKAHP